MPRPHVGCSAKGKGWLHPELYNANSPCTGFFYHQPDSDHGDANDCSLCTGSHYNEYAIDWGAKGGDKIYAQDAGTVMFSGGDWCYYGRTPPLCGRHWGHGKVELIHYDHTHIYAIYAHLDKLGPGPIRGGTSNGPVHVAKGAVLGTAGNTGYSKGPPPYKAGGRYANEVHVAFATNITQFASGATKGFIQSGTPLKQATPSRPLYTNCTAPAKTKYATIVRRRSVYYRSCW